MPVDTAVILAAGQGKRLLPLTQTIPKSLIPIAQTTILDHILQNLSRSGIEHVAIVIGYLGNVIRQRIGIHYRGLQVTFLENPLYGYANNLASLWYAQAFFYSDILLLEGDTFLEEGILPDLASCPHQNAMAVDRLNPNLMCSPLVSLDNSGLVDKMILDWEPEKYPNLDLSKVYKPVNAYKLSFDFLRQHLMPRLNLHFNLGLTADRYEVLIRDLLAEDAVRFTPVLTGQRRWVDIDTHQDLARAIQMFADESELLKSK
ncbi:MAG: phosphocholine cytidylyltransferase family protein [bacterium]|nr:phosphocholine cytidylyltransferase family protein [bacterium]